MDCPKRRGKNRGSWCGLKDIASILECQMGVINEYLGYNSVTCFDRMVIQSKLASSQKALEREKVNLATQRSILEVRAVELHNEKEMLETKKGKFQSEVEKESIDDKRVYDCAVVEVTVPEVTVQVTMPEVTAPEVTVLESPVSESYATTSKFSVDPDTIQAGVSTTQYAVQLNIPKHDTANLIAMLTHSWSRIVKVYSSPIEVIDDRGIKSTASVLHSMKKGSLLSGQRFKCWDGLDDDLKDAYLVQNDLP